MKEKFMSMRKYVVTSLAMVMTASQLVGCASATTKELTSMVEADKQIEISIKADNKLAESDAKITEWKELASLTDQEDLRKVIDDQLYIISFGDNSKNGVLYVNPDTEGWDANNTLERVYKNKAFKELWEDSEVQSNIQDAVKKAYCDVDDYSTEELKMVALDSYFNLFKEEKDGGNFNGDSTVTRAEVMTAIARASEQADPDAKAKDELVEQLGESDDVVYAGYVVDNSYLDLKSKSLDSTTYNGAMTRAEVIYMLVSKYYGKELAKIGTDEECYSDCKNAGDIAEVAETAGKDYYRTANLEYMIEHPNKGMDEELYKAMEVAYEHGIINTEDESNWSTAATKLDTMFMLTNVYEDLGTKCNCSMGANEAVDTTQAEGSTDRMTYEQFLYELNIADNAGAQNSYNWYNKLIEAGFSSDEAFEDTANSVKNGGFDNIVAAGSTTETESTEVANNDSTPANNNSNTSSNPSSSSTPASTDSSNTSSDEGNTNVEDDDIRTPEEAAALREQMNGGHLTGNSTLSEEELQEEREIWSTIKGY